MGISEIDAWIGVAVFAGLQYNGRISIRQSPPTLTPWHQRVQLSYPPGSICPAGFVRQGYVRCGFLRKL